MTDIDLTGGAKDEYWYGADVATFGDRLVAAREYAALTQAEFARKLGVKKSTAAAWEEDLAEPRANKLSMMAGLLNVSIKWLLTGEGDDLKPPADAAEEPEPEITKLLTEIRDVRTQLVRAGDQLSRLEKRLRLRMKG